MKKLLILALPIISTLQLSGCSVMSAVATSNRMEDARASNAGKQLVPKDGGTYLIPVGLESASYLGTGNTDFKINSTSFTQPKGTYSIVTATPGVYNVYANKRVVGGGEATATVEVKKGEAVCFHVVNPLTTTARIESTKNDACDPFLRPLRNINSIQNIN